MVALDNSAIFGVRRFHPPRISLALGITLAALAVGVAALALRGFSDNGLRLATQSVWRFDLFVFFAALMAGPLGRAVTLLRPLADISRDLLLGFSGGMAVYVASVVLPNLLIAPDGIRNQGVTTGMTFFVFFTGAVTLVMAAAVNRRLCALVGGKSCSAMLGVAVAYFWLCYSLMSLAYISGPHRPDAFHGWAVVLMVLALLARFAERCFGPTRSLPVQNRTS